MTIVIGIDEAGLGPNLGPFVVAATVWRVAEDAPSEDLTTLLAPGVTTDPRATDGRLIYADSKALFQPHQGLAKLEQGVLPLWLATGVSTTSLREASRQLHGADDWDESPWLVGRDLLLPRDVSPPTIARSVEGLTTRWAHPLGVACQIVSPAAFNRRLEQGNKAEVVTTCHLELLRRLDPTAGVEPVLIFSDKHGGRQSYTAALAHHWPDVWVETITETPTLSHYRLGHRELRFEPRAERHLATAAASMTAKYVRELHMQLFNEFWRSHCPTLKPTQGYPVDAKRFSAEIEPVRRRLGIPMDILWRRK
jgi:hypothetical protein